MWRIEPDFFVPLLVFSIPIIAIVGGITAGIVKTLGRQRLAELAQQERIAAIQRGMDISKLPPPPVLADDDESQYLSLADRDRRRAQGFMIAGLITTFAGIGITAFLLLLAPDEENVWAVGLVPGAVGIALLLSAWLVRPRTTGGTGSGAPRSS